MVRDAAAEVLPFSQLGGIVLGARAAILHGVAAPLAFASTIVDVTTEMMAQIAYIVLGVLLLSARAPRSSVAVSLTTVFVIGLVLAALAAGLFIVLQRYGHRVTGKLVARLMPGAVAPHRGGGRQARCDLSCPGTRRPFRCAASCRMDRKCGRGMDRLSPDRGASRLAAVMAVESLVYATRSAAAFIPNALGCRKPLTRFSRRCSVSARNSGLPCRC